eukprot:c8176_g1_i1.p1 GENE.c8176_g1_i1~~c8176_g1_i1.p1  ORF type:complete len:217 (-),score=66.66 c8176_g1_i1:188-838(-)
MKPFFTLGCIVLVLFTTTTPPTHAATTVQTHNQDDDTALQANNDNELVVKQHSTEAITDNPNVVNDDEIAQAYAVQDTTDDPGALPEAAVEETKSTFTPCDPDDMAPGDYAGRLSDVANDIPDPLCTQQRSCGTCLARRACGWCALTGVCLNTRSKSKECAFNENTDVCAPPCPHMWHMTWPAGRQSIVDAFCDDITEAYANKTTTANWANSQFFE